VTAVAVWDRIRGTLAWNGVESGRAWAAIARELALALEPGASSQLPLASGFKDASRRDIARGGTRRAGGSRYPRLHHREPAWPLASRAAPIRPRLPSHCRAKGETPRSEPSAGTPASAHGADAQTDPVTDAPSAGIRQMPDRLS
jgi:hypothetical protein